MKKSPVPEPIFKPLDAIPKVIQDKLIEASHHPIKAREMLLCVEYVTGSHSHGYDEDIVKGLKRQSIEKRLIR